ncbi:hypothetical protein [Floridanema evergladense]|uniref:Uncharacterized protein n=1 Tax=Floridaenema evergladense BLCC-F167 TaxID=3153639 RepID=A0ABV4WVW4_9CYAN
MFATITDNPSEIRQIFQLSTSSSSKLWELAQKANELALMVEERWEMFSDKERELLITFAYAIIEPPKGILDTIGEFVSRFLLALVLATIAIKGEQDAFIAYSSNSKRLINAILGKVEQENLAYQKALSEAIEEAFSNSENRKSMTAEEACERIRGISDRVIREL